VGFGAFFVMEKTFRVLGDEEESHTHTHTHTHTHSPRAQTLSPNPSESALSSGVSTNPNGELRSRYSKEVDGNYTGQVEPEIKASGHEVVRNTSKLSAYLNLFGDFTHNMFVFSFGHLPFTLIDYD
jgi:solute carrier family 39 (zinc transporter), member 7